MPRLKKHTVADRIQAYLRIVEGQPLSYATMAKALGHPNRYYVRQVCRDLAAAGRIAACGLDYYSVPLETHSKGEPA